MYFNTSLQDYNFIIEIENCCLKILSGNWGIFEESFSNHMHSYYELHYVTGGHGTLITDAFEMPIYKGCFYLLPPKTNHEQLSCPTDFLKEYYISFELVNYSEKDLVWEYLFKNGFYDTAQIELEAFFESIARESKSKQYGYLELMQQYIKSIFIMLIRSKAKQICNASIPDINLDEKRILIIDDAFLFNYDTVSLLTLSKQLSLSIRQTQRFITEKYGVPFSVLRYRAKLSHSALLLSTTNLSVNEICFRIGYKNCSYFCRTFKKHYKMSPLSYREINSHKDR